MTGATGGEGRPIRVLVVDDEPMVGSYLTGMFAGSDDIDVIGVAHDGAEAIEETMRSRPDVVLMDLRMPGVDGIRATAEIRGLAEPPVVVAMTTLDTDEHLLDALDAGAAGFVLKTTPADRLASIVTAAARGAAVLSPDMLNRLRRRVRRDDVDQEDERVAALSPREREVLDLLATGAGNADIATQLFLSESSVKSVVSRLMVALDCANRTQLALYAAGHPPANRD